MEDNQDTRILAKLEHIRGWLRMHGDYDVTINLQGWYGCRIEGTYGEYNLTISQFGRTIKLFSGTGYVLMKGMMSQSIFLMHLVAMWLL